MYPTCPDIIRPLLVVLALGFTLSGPFAHAKVSSRVQKVQQLYDRLFFDDASEVCRAVLDAGKNSREDLMALLRYKGLLSAVQGKRGDAVAAFRQLLLVNPLAEIGDGHPPRVQRAFALARRWFERQKPLMVLVEAPREVLRGASAQLTARVTSDPLASVAHLVLHVRTRGSTYRSHPTDSRTEASWKLDLARIEGADRAPRLEYYVSALDSNYNELTLAGSHAAPRSIQLAGPATPLLPVPTPVDAATTQRDTPTAAPWYTRWWIWASVGTVLAVSAVAIGVAASAPADKVDAPVILEPGGSP